MIQSGFRFEATGLSKRIAGVVLSCFLFALINTVGLAWGATTISVEAESGNLTVPMAIQPDPLASGQSFVEVPQGIGDNLIDASLGGPGQASFSINIPEAGKYVLWARTVTPTGKREKGSFYVTRDGTKLKEWSVPKSATWKWNKVAAMSLTPGTLSLAFRQRTDGTKLDQIILSNEKKFNPKKSNLAPTVNAGPNQTVSLPGSANLNGTVTDDGLPSQPGALTTTWSKVSGPGTVTFGNAAAVDTTANFSQTGTYVLRLAANDSLLQFFDDVTITVNPSNFTLVALPDTQYYSRDFATTFAAQTQWIVNNKDSRNIVHLVHLGDVVENANITAEWDHANAAMSLIEDPNTTGLLHGIPYGIAVGNHEQMPAGSPAGDSTQLYNTYFGESRFSGRTYYGGHFGSNNDNHVSFFSAGGMDFIVIYLEYDEAANPNVLAWADNLLKTHVDKRAIVVGHYFVEPGNPAPFGLQGQDTYDALKGNANLFLMLAGHRHGEGQRTDVFNGNAVHTLLSDYQERENGGDGWLRIIEFSPANNEIRIRTYSPTRDQFETDGDSQFTLSYDMSPNSNLPPITRVGPDQTITLPNVATLDGTVTDDGTVTTTWSKVSGPGTVTFADANAVDTTASFSEAGPYLLQLTANDGEKASSADIVILVHPQAPPIVTLNLEAESGMLTDPMAIQSAPNASGGQFVISPQGSGDNFDDTTRGGPGQVSLSFDIPQGGLYAMWARTIAPSGGSDSFYVTSGSALIQEWTVPLSAGWQWNKVAEVFVGAGPFDTKFRQREDGTWLDKVLLTNDLSFVPN
jgi:hypothetical protein